MKSSELRSAGITLTLCGLMILTGAALFLLDIAAWLPLVVVGAGLLGFVLYVLVAELYTELRLSGLRVPELPPELRDEYERAKRQWLDDHPPGRGR